MTKTYFKRTEKRCSELTMSIQGLCVGLVIVHYAQTGNLAPSIFLLIKYSWPFRIYMCCCCFVLAHVRLYAQLHNKVWPAHILHSGDKDTQCLQAAHSDIFRSSLLSQRR